MWRQAGSIYGQSKFLETTQGTERFELSRYPVHDCEEEMRAGRFKFSALPGEFDWSRRSVLSACVGGEVAGTGSVRVYRSVVAILGLRA